MSTPTDNISKRLEVTTKSIHFIVNTAPEMASAGATQPASTDLMSLAALTGALNPKPALPVTAAIVIVAPTSATGGDYVDKKTAIDEGGKTRKDQTFQSNTVKTAKPGSKLGDNIKLFCAYLLVRMVSNPSTEQSITFLSYISFFLHIIEKNGSSGLIEAFANFKKQAKEKSWFKLHGIDGCDDIVIEETQEWSLPNTCVNAIKIINFSKTNLDTFAHNTLLRKIVDDIEKSNFSLNVLSTTFVPHYQYLVDVFIQKIFLVLNAAEKKKFDFFKKVISLYMSFPVTVTAQTKLFIKILNEMMMKDLGNLSLDDILAVLKINQHVDNGAGVKLLFNEKEKDEILESILPKMTNDKVPVLMDLQWGFFKTLSRKSFAKLSQYLFDHGDILQAISLPWEKMAQDSISSLVTGVAMGDVKAGSEASTLSLTLPCVEKSREDSILKSISELNRTLKMPVALDTLRLGAIVLCAKLLNYIGTLPITRDSMVHVIYITFLLDTLYKPAGKGPDLKSVLDYFLMVSKKMGWFEKLQMPECNGVTADKLLIRLLLGHDVTNKMNFLRSTNLFRYGKSVALPRIIDSEFGSDVMERIDHTFNPWRKKYDLYVIVWSSKEMGELTSQAVIKFEDNIPMLIQHNDQLYIYGLDSKGAAKLTKLHKNVEITAQSKFVITKVPQRLYASDINPKIFKLISQAKAHYSIIPVNNMFKAHYGNWVASLMPSLFGVLQNTSLVSRTTSFNFVCPFSGLILDFPVNPSEVQFNYFIKDIVRYTILNSKFFGGKEIFPILQLIEYYEIKTGKKLLNPREKSVLLQCMLNSTAECIKRKAQIMRYQWTIFNDLPKGNFASMETLFNDYYKKHIESVKKLEGEFPWEKEFSDSLNASLAVEDRKYLIPNYICPDTGKELDIVYINNIINIKIVFHLDGSTHYYLDRDDENHETLARNQALENAGWLNFCFTLKPEMFAAKDKVIAEFVFNAKKFIQDSVQKAKFTHASVLFSELDMATHDLKDRLDMLAITKKSANASAAQSAKPPLLFSLHDYQVAPIASSTILVASTFPSTALDLKCASEILSSPKRTPILSLCKSSTVPKPQQVNHKMQGNIGKPQANTIHAIGKICTNMIKQNMVADSKKSKNKKKKSNKTGVNNKAG